MSKKTDIQIGVIANVRYTPFGNGVLCEVKAEVDGRTTNWLPLKSKISSFYKVHIPPRVGDQCIVFNPSGKNEDGFVDGDLAYEKVALPKEANENKIVKWTKDGTIYIHDVEAKKISLDTPCEVEIKAPKMLLESDINVVGSLRVNGVYVP